MSFDTLCKPCQTKAYTNASVYHLRIWQPSLHYGHLIDTMYHMQILPIQLDFRASLSQRTSHDLGHAQHGLILTLAAKKLQADWRVTEHFRLVYIVSSSDSWCRTHISQS